MALKIFRSSAGSGKTFTLVREYIKLLIKKPTDFKHILAITFTNKATEEMKSRILSQLKKLAEGEDEAYANALIALLGDRFDADRVRANAKEAYALIIHNYSRFEVSTIDSFFSRVLKSFAKELDLPLSYEVEMNVDNALREAKDLVFRSLDDNPKLKRWLALYSINQLDDEKSWNIDAGLEKIGKNLFKESFQEGLKATQWDLESFELLVSTLKADCTKFENLIRQKGQQAVKLIEDNGLVKTDFYHGNNGAVNAFYKAANFDIDFHKGARFIKTINGDFSWGAKKSPNADLVNELGASHFSPLAAALKDLMEEPLMDYQTHKAILRNIYAYAVLEAINEKLVEYRSEKNVMLISDTNALLKDLLTEAETPFLFEKIGSFYHHIMIDEFQDTSSFQWKNLEPLVTNALSEGHEVLIVGDVKQSIYRFRGGNMRLLLTQVKDDLANFYQLGDGEEKTDQVLQDNWRSLSHIVAFNNALYGELKSQIRNHLFLNDATLFDLAYEGHQQNVKAEVGGYVEVNFYEEDFKERTIEHLVAKVNENKKMHYDYDDMLILVNRNSDIMPIAAAFLQHEIPFINAESLKLTESTVVQFIISLLRYLDNEQDQVLVAQLLTLYARLHKQNIEEQLRKKESEKLDITMLFPSEFIHKKHQLKKLELFEMLTTLLRIFALKPFANAYLQQFLDVVLEQSSKGNHTISSFLDWWELESDKQTVATSEGVNAIRIMTIHKAKGLEAPIVFIPFANWKVMPNASQHQFWTSEIPANYKPLSFVPLDFNKKLLDSHFKAAFLKESEESALDMLNKTYVATTRPREKLFISAPKNKTLSANSIENLFWNSFHALGLAPNEEEDVISFTVGDKNWSKMKSEQTAEVESIQVYPETQFDDKLSIRNESDRFFMLQEGEAASNIKFGNQIHELLSKIEVKEDLSGALNAMRQRGELSENFSKEVEKRVVKLLAHQDVANWFSGGYEVYNEQEIWFEGKRHQPDRVLIKDGAVTIIDYKKEVPSDSHLEQVKRYMNIFSQMGYAVVSGFLVYVETLEVKEVIV